VSADRDLLYQAVLNLVSNAVKYTPEGGQVTVRMTPREEQRTMLIEVTDTGAGIPKEDLPRMFEKFFRVEKNKQMAKGTGLGLNLVKQIVEQVHGGQISLQSEVGKGSTFGITLPLLP
jgi:two-component system phosphate regulon sensor histidine kinase PhoR